MLKHLLVLLSLAYILPALGENINTKMVTPDRVYLSGIDARHTRTWQFRCSDGQQSGKWTTIEVPSCWEQQGFGAYTYGRFYKTQGLKPSKEEGLYRTTFTIPKDRRGKIFRLVFEGAMTDTHVWIDGRLVGRPHQGGFTEFAYDITQFVSPGTKHRLEILVKKESDNASVNSAERRADWWLFGGIYRPVYIDILPVEHIRNLQIDARANGEIYTHHEGGTRLCISIDGRELAYDSQKGCHIFHNPKTWHPEHPHLYTATFSLGRGGHSITRRIGFRTIEFRPHDGLYLNGTRLVVKGTNRHCFDPETGRAMSYDMSLRDAQLIKQMNMNAVRCHYPSDSHFLNICDSIGLLYIDELPGWQTHYDDSTACRLLPELILRDSSHPCVFLWSNGNEGGWNTSVDRMFGQIDLQHRKVIHPWADYDGIDTHHYPAYQTGAYRLHQGQNVFMPTEFLHGKYDKGQGAALADMWAHWNVSPRFAGAFLWAFVDEAVRRTDLPTGKSKGKRYGQKGFSIKDCILDSDGGNGPDGCMDPYRQPEASFYAIREVWSPIAIDNLQITPSFDGRILVHNRYLSTNLSECAIKYNLRSDRGVLLEHGSFELKSDVCPGESAYAHMKISPTFSQSDILEVIAYGNNGDEVCRWSAPIHRPAPLTLTASTTSQPHYSPLPVSEGEENSMFVGIKAECHRRTRHIDSDGTIVTTMHYRGGADSIVWRQTPDGAVIMDAVLLNDDRGHGYNGDFITDEGKWQIGVTFNIDEAKIDSMRWLGRGPYRVWRNRLQGQQYGVWGLAYNNTVTGQYNSSRPPVYPEFKGYRADVRWVEIYASDKKTMRITTDTEGLYMRTLTPEEPVDETPGEMGGTDEGRRPKQEKTMVKFPKGNLSFLISIPPIQSYKPLEQLGAKSQPDIIRIKKGDEGFRIRLKFEYI